MGRFAKNVAIMSVAPVIMQSLAFIVTPIVTRLYTPEDFGMFSIYGAILGPIGIFSTMSYSSAIVLPKREKDAANLFALSLFFTIVWATLSISIIFFKNSFLLSKYKDEQFMHYLWVIPIVLFFNGLYMSLRYWNIRKESFGKISAAVVSRYVANNSVILIAGFAGYASGLFIILGDIAGGIASPAILSKSVWQKNKQLFFDNIRVSRMIAMAKRYSNFPKFLLINDFFSRFGEQMPIYILSIYFSQGIIGFYSFSLRLLTMPMNFLGNSIGEVYYQKAAQKDENSTELLEELFKYLVLLGLPIFIFIGIIGEEIFYVFFGKGWSEGGFYAQILCLFMLIKFITIPASSLMLIYEKQKYALYLNIATITVSSISLTIGGILNNVYLSFVLFSLSNSLVYAVYGFWLMKHAGLKIITAFRIILKNFLICLPMIIAILAIKFLFSFSFLYICIISSLFLAILYSIIMITDHEGRKLLLMVLNKFKINFK